MVKDISEQIKRLKSKLYSTEKSLSVINEKEIQIFEKIHDIILPEEYRRFILEIANGNINGYMSGIIPLGYIFTDFPGDQAAQESFLANIRKEFPFEYPWCLDAEIDENLSLFRYTYPRCMRHLTGNGSLIFENDGCGDSWNLIVTGPQRGKVWRFFEGGLMISPCVPSMDFLDWVEVIHDGKDPLGDWGDLYEKMRPQLERSKKEFY